jgi:hypothetical protein
MNFMNLKALSYKICELIHRPVGPAGDFCVLTFDANRRKGHGALGKDSK